MGKFRDVSSLIYADLSVRVALTDLLVQGAEGIYPLIADEDSGSRFITYSISYNSKPSKDGVYDFEISIQSWAETYNLALEMADEVTNALGASENVYVEGAGGPQFNEQSEFYIQQTFNINK